ncbi:MAG TPA: lytic murein transglycosylase [Gaiellaceae bacterium]|nr:lytic murein transglycosylase [Gaiellaceae bacterium]
MNRVFRVAAVVAACVAVASVAAAGSRADTFVTVHSNDATASQPSNVVLFHTTQQQLTPLGLQTLWRGAGATYGIPWEVLAAINKVESNFGQNMGPSSAGAVGWMQFMPSTWLRYGVDANGDGVADPWNPNDAVYSAARYLAAAGGASDLSRAVYAYNHATWYVNDVLGLASAYGYQGVTDRGNTFSIDYSQEIADARSALAAAKRQHTAAAATEGRLVRAENRLLNRADQAALLTERAAARQGAVQLDLRVSDAHARTEQSAAKVAQARSALAEAKGAASAAAAATPAASGSYVFPVGGGAGVVSVSHLHHDYPAADIAAPLGSPVYAITDAVVLKAWTTPVGTCGIGLTIRASDGRPWTYCHLLYEDPTLQPGALVGAGTMLGLVGATGDATGPHLHLQLDPPLSYPQLEPWFQAFAGTAFTWRDGTPTDRMLTNAGAAPHVFEQVVEFTRNGG